ncbi:MAG: hypothetical protein QXT28_08960 [Thermofilaceae archaeon]
MKEEVRVLWVSRHQPVAAQLDVLKQKLGDVRVIVWQGHAPNAETVLEEALRVGARYIVPVLPLSFIARLAELAPQKGITVLFSRMEPIASTRDPEEVLRLLREKPGWRAAVTYADGVTRVYEFVRFEVVRSVELVTEPL